MTAYSFSVNGMMRTVEAEAEMPLLYALRNTLGLTAAKFGCGLGQCGACTVIVDGQAVRSCSTPISAVEGTKVTTLEGLGTSEKPHPVQAAFIAEQAAQCGYCINGMVMTSVALLAQTPSPDLGQIKEALAGNLCRCGTHQRILQAVSRAAGRAAP
ncbi:MAG: (2Fe-2S)-binding protein [Alphaproteobacteria bacterium]|jgi:nicotinate dehydrogenase subunit A|nr:(2Fe-2S)-binding protein [Alphaproteobacteria bacterium]